ncbi:type II secretion system protein M [Sphingomicrobium flavum]|uniref:type II secretion system protein M n=1 Tax=Sphingomicrobium flavum TaxID=1229164 RepID=UPI0021ADB9B6|nr:type II secretion system protein M [Sphingomicrobium flavum]
MRDWWLERSRREQMMLGIMALIAAPIIFYYLILRPLYGWQDSARDDYLMALDRHGRIAALADAGGSDMPPFSGRILTYLQTQADESGFALSTIVEQAPGRVRIVIESGAAPALLGWIDRLEREGLTVENLQITPSGEGNVRLEALLVGDET